MTRDDIISFGKKKYGDQWISSLAKDINCSLTSVGRVASGETPVSRRIELEMQRVMREERIRQMNLNANTRY